MSTMTEERPQTRTQDVPHIVEEESMFVSSDATIHILQRTNPYAPDTHEHARFELYREGLTVGDYLHDAIQRFGRVKPLPHIRGLMRDAWLGYIEILRVGSHH